MANRETHLDRHQRPVPGAVRDLAHGREQHPEPEAGERPVDQAVGQPGIGGGLTRHQPDAREGGADTEPDEDVGAFTGGEADDRGKDGGADGRDGGDHAHPAAGEAAVEEGAAGAAAKARDRAPGQITARGVAGDDDGQHQAPEQGSDAGEERDRPRRRTTGRKPADEVREAVGDCRDQGKNNAHQVAMTPTVQVTVASNAAASSIRMLIPTALSACFVDGHACSAPTRLRSAR